MYYSTSPSVAVVAAESHLGEMLSQKYTHSHSLARPALLSFAHCAPVLDAVLSRVCA